MKRLTPLLALVLWGCTEANYETMSSLAQGTTYTITVKNPPPGLTQKIDETFDEIDRTFSVFNPSSIISRVNRNEIDAVSPLFEECFSLAKNIHALTDGYFDPTVGPLVDAWGFGAADQQKSSSPNVDSLMSFVGLDKIGISNGHIIKDDPRTQLAFGSIAKGFTVDRLALLLEAEGVTDYMVEVGGEVRTRGVNPRGVAWRIGIDRPAFGIPGGELSDDGGQISGGRFEAIVSFSPPLTSIATSGNYRNWFVDSDGRTRVHIIDPKTGVPALGEILSVSVVASECAVADAWATGLMAVGTVEGLNRLLAGMPDGLEYYIIYGAADAAEVIRSDGFPVVE